MVGTWEGSWCNWIFGRDVGCQIRGKIIVGAPCNPVWRSVQDAEVVSVESGLRKFAWTGQRARYLYGLLYFFSICEFICQNHLPFLNNPYIKKLMQYSKGKTVNLIAISKKNESVFNILSNLNDSSVLLSSCHCHLRSNHLYWRLLNVKSPLSSSIPSKIQQPELEDPSF